MNNNNSPKESADFPLKQEDHEKAKASPSSSTSAASQWLRLKDPRIVRVSRAFGGKDRHSKVCTIRGLRDRRVRLSVQTAIQLYDLQDRLGLSQPSKVVDWLLNAAKHEIDELPPLPSIIPIPGNNFTLHGFPSSMITSNNNNEASTSSHQPNEQNYNYLNRGIVQWEEGSKAKDDSEEMVTEEEENKQGSNNKEAHHGAHVLSNSNLLPLRPNHHHHHPPSFLGLLNTMPIGNYQQLEHSSHDVNAHQLGNHGFASNQTDLHSINVVPFPSALSLSSTQPYFPSQHVTTTSMDMDPRQINSHYQMLSSGSFSTSSFSLAMMTPKFLNPPNSRESPSHKDHDFTSK